MMLDFPLMQLQDQSSIDHEPFVIRSAVSALASKQLLIPPAAGFDITDTDEGLWFHLTMTSFTNHERQPFQLKQVCPSGLAGSRRAI